MDVDLKPLAASYRPVDPNEQELRETYEGKAYIFSCKTGQAEWLTPERDADDAIRLVLNPDEGGPLFSAWQFLAGLGLPVSFSRDEVQPDCNRS